MKNKRTLLFAGILAAFLMLAVPFAIVAFDAEDVNAADTTYAGTDEFWSGFRSDSSSTITLTENIKVSSTVELGAGSKILYLNGFTITYTNTGNLFFKTGDKSTSLTIYGEIDGSAIYADRVVCTTTTTMNFTLTVNGGTYSGEHVFLLHSQPNSTDVIPDYSGNLNASFYDVMIEAEISAIWCGNEGVEHFEMRNSTVVSDGLGLYLGSINEATLIDTDVESVSTALEIKSGVVNISGGSYISKNFDDSNKTIDNSGSGGPVSTVFINNGYLGAADVVETFVTISDNVTIRNESEESDKKAVVVASGTEYGPVSLTWNGHDSDIIAFYVSSGKSPIRINDCLVVNNVTDLQNSLNEGVSKIGLASGFENPTGFSKVTITKSVEIVGFDNVVAPAENSDNSALKKIGFQIGPDSESDTKFNGNVSFKGIEINSEDNISIDVKNTASLLLDVNDCMLNSTTYAINIRSTNNNISLNIDGSSISGYCAFQTWAKELNAVIADSHLFGYNTATEGPNCFAAIVVNQCCHADITITDSSIGIDYDDEIYGFESIADYRGESSGILRFEGNVIIGSEGDNILDINFSEGGLENCALLEGGKGVFKQSTAVMELAGSMDLTNVYIPKGCTFTMEPGSVFSGTINGPEDASIGFSNVKAGNDGIVITAGSLSINGSMSSVNSGTITLNGSNVKLSGTVESGVTINVAPGCKPTIVDSLRFEAGSSLVSNVPANEVFAQGSGDVYYDAGSKVNNNSIVEDQKINASTGASYEKVTVFLKTNGPMYSEQPSVKVFVGDYYVDTLNNVQFDGPAGYILEGWYTEFGLKITDLTKANNSITTLVANFIYDPSSAPVSPGAPGSAEPEESSEFDIADHVVLIEAVIAVLVLIGFVAYIRKN